MALAWRQSWPAFYSWSMGGTHPKQNCFPVGLCWSRQGIWDGRGRWKPWEREEREGEDVVIDSKTDKMPCAVWPCNIKESATAITPSSGQPPIQKTFMRRECTFAELIERAAKFQQKSRESIQAWLVWLWDSGVMAFHCPGRRQRKRQHHHTACPPAA